MSKKLPKFSATRSPQTGSPRLGRPALNASRALTTGLASPAVIIAMTVFAVLYFWAKSRDGISLSVALGGTPHPSSDLPNVGAWTLTGRAAVPTFGRVGEK
jgi:hypothetical protein